MRTRWCAHVRVPDIRPDTCGQGERPRAARRAVAAQPDYPLAMKCLAMRIGAEFHDEEDVRFLLRLLDIRSYDQALRIIAKYCPLERFPQKTLCALEDLLPKRSA